MHKCHTRDKFGKFFQKTFLTSDSYTKVTFIKWLLFSFETLLPQTCVIQSSIHQLYHFERDMAFLSHNRNISLLNSGASRFTKFLAFNFYALFRQTLQIPRAIHNFSHFNLKIENILIIIKSELFKTKINSLLFSL